MTKNKVRKNEIERHSIQLGLINLVVPILVLVIVVAAIICSVSLKVNSDMKTDADEIASFVKSGNYLQFDSLENLVIPKTYVYYFDSDGNKIDHHAKGKSLVENLVVIDSYDNYFSSPDSYNLVVYENQRYVTCKGEMDNIEGYENYKYFVVFKNVESEYSIYDVTMQATTIVVGASAIIISIFSLVFARIQIKPYKTSVLKNMQLVSDISHEFNTPLAIVNTTVASILEKTDATVEEVSDKLITVTHEIGRLKKMVRDMLVLSRSDADRLTLDLKLCNVSDLISELIEPFQMMCEMDGKTFTASIDKGITVVTDSDKVKQCAIIMLDNACKYTKPGESVDLRLFQTFGRVHIVVTDTGCGVSDVELSKVFERFYRADSSRTAATGGSGLGLSIVKSVALNLNGSVTATQNKPKGFKIEFEFEKRKN